MPEQEPKGRLALKQTMRDAVTGELSLEYFAKRFQEGWKIAGIEWVRDSDEAIASKSSLNLLSGEATLPYGFQLTGSGLVEENPLEAAVLLLILDQVIREKRIQEIASALNEQGYVTREGSPWSAAEVFNLMPRLIEAGPSLLKSDAWRQRRPTVLASVQKPN